MTKKLIEYLRSKEDEHLERLCQWLKIPSISADHAFDKHTQAAGKFVADLLRKIGMREVRSLQTSGHKVIYAESAQVPGQPTLMLYGHYDVQPPDPIEEWSTDPFEPTVEGDFLLGRGTADDKGQTMMWINALESWLSTVGSLPINVKCFIEGDEESGSAGEEAIRTYAADLKCDAVVICDSPWIDHETPTICYGARGMAYYDIEIRGARTDLHSGMYGNLVRNPINTLCQIIAQIHEPSGRISIPGFYDDVKQPTDEELSRLAAIPVDESALKNIT